MRILFIRIDLNKYREVLIFDILGKWLRYVVVIVYYWSKWLSYIDVFVLVFDMGWLDS